MLNDILDLEREDIAKIPGMTPETSDQLMAFVSELTDEDGGEENPADGMSGLLGPPRAGLPRRTGRGRGGRGPEGAAGREVLVRGAWRKTPARAPWTRWSGWRRRRGCRCCRARAPPRSARSWESRRSWR